MRSSGYEVARLDRELNRGLAAYNDTLGRWWLDRATNPAHRYAYRRIAEHIAASFPHRARCIVDYACGAGQLVCELSRQFPQSQFIGYDGSAFLLSIARDRLLRKSNRLMEKVTLVEASLPNIHLPGQIADLVIFAFPNLVPSSTAKYPHLLRATDLSVAKKIADASGSDYDVLIRDRMVALDLRRLLKAGGACVRVEYGSERREAQSREDLLRTCYEEGSLDQEVGGRRLKQLFRVAASSYFRSSVIEDVYCQSLDPGDRTGGYVITILRAC